MTTHFDDADSTDEKFLSSVLNSISAIIMVVSADGRLQYLNDTAGKHLQIAPADAVGKRGGEVFNCAHQADHPDGCGYGDYCRTGCVIKAAVNHAVEGVGTQRESMVLTVSTPKGELALFFLVSAAPFDFRGTPHALVTVEDISEVIQLQSILPICAECKKVRDDQDYWQRVDEYFRDRLPVRFTHGLCPDCYTKAAAELED